MSLDQDQIDKLSIHCIVTSLGEIKRHDDRYSPLAVYKSSFTAQDRCCNGDTAVQFVPLSSSTLAVRDKRIAELEQQLVVLKRRIREAGERVAEIGG
jgi:hypothetical protein